MRDDKRTKEELIEEVNNLRTIISDLGKDRDKFQTIAENTSDTIAITSFDLKAKYLYVSPSVKKLLGYDASELIGKSFFKFIHPDDKKVIRSLVKKYLNLIVKKILRIDDPNISETIEFRFRTKEGDWFYLQSTVNFIGKNLLAVTRDVSDRKQAELELKQSEENFRNIFDISPIGIELYDADGMQLNANNASLKMFGIADVSEIKGFNLFEGTTFDAKKKNKLQKGESVTYQSAFDFEKVKALNQYKTHKSGIAYFDYIVTPLMNKASNTIDGYLLQVQDISERKQAEQELQMSEARFKNLYESLGDAVYVTKMGGENAGKIVEVNLAAVKQTGYTREELLQMNIIKDLYILGSANINADEWEQKLNNGERVSATEKKRRKDGTEYWTVVTVTPIEFKGEKAALSINHDITKLKQAELELQNSEQDYRGLFENSHDAIIIFAPENEIVLDVNERACKLYGYNRDEFIGMSLKNISNNISEGEKQIERTLKEGFFNQFETMQYRKDGSSIYLEINASVIQYKGKQAILSNNRDITERKKTEAIIQESEEKFRSLYLSANDAIFLMKDGIFISCNPKTLEIFDCTEDEILGYSPSGFSPEYQADGSLSKHIAFEKMKAALAGEPQSFEWIHLKKNGTPFYAEISLNKIVLSDGVYVQAMVRDISKRKIAEEKQRISEERYRLISDLTSDYLFSVKVSYDGKVTPSWVSGSFEKITGYTFEEYCARGGWRAIIHEDDLEHDEEVFARLLKNQEITSVIRTYHKKGNIVWVKVYGHPIWDEESNRLAGIIGAVEDITEQKRAEIIQKIQYNISLAVNQTVSLDEYIGIIRKELGELIDTTNFFVATYEEETDTIHLPYIADQYDTHTFFPAKNSFTAHVIKTQRSLLVSPKEIEKLKTTANVETVGTVSKSWLGVPMVIDGIVTGAIVVQSYEDENAYNSKDMEILEFVSHTIGTSIERKKAEQDLKIALIKATESDRLKSAFLATMSHELRTPLNAIIGFSDIIDEDLAIEDILKYTNTINSSGNHLLTIVNDLFDITLIESGQTKIEKVNEELHPFLYEVFDIIKAEQQNINKTNLDLSLIIPSENTTLIVNTDPSKLKQVLINLLKNAIKFTDHGYVKFGYTIEQDHNKSVLKFYVEDSGIGVPEEKREFIFDIFRQAQESYTKTHGGTGIGLTISKKLIELLGGRIWLESIEENLAIGQRGGTTFYFTLPFNENVSDEKSVQKETNTNSKTLLKAKTVLVVEDVESSYEYLKVVLEKSGVNTLWSKNGEEAIKLCKENATVDLVLMDINMPVMNGYEATKEIKKFKPNLPIIAQTAYAIIGDRQLSIDAGCDDYISKPIKREELLKKIKKFL